MTRWDSLSLADDNTVAGKMGVVLIAFASSLFGTAHKPGKFQVRWAKPHAFKVRWAHPHQPPVSGLGRILQEERAPLELLKMASVESGFEASALSPKGARGIWQLMPDTARRFGLTVDSFRDDRTDPEQSTRAAARYWKTLNGLFGDWKLTLAAYNAGEGRVLGAITQGGTRDFYELSRRGLLPQETRRYVPKVLRSFGDFAPNEWPLRGSRGQEAVSYQRSVISQP